MPHILESIMATKRQEILEAQARVPARELQARLSDAPPVRDFFEPLAKGKPIRLIAEVKKASPSKGIIRSDFDHVAIARLYQQAGASCLSVLTDEHYFQGHLQYLTDIREQVETPLLRKDFMLDSYQLLEARVAGADAILLIAECLDDCQLRRLHNEAIELGMTPLVELHDPANIGRVLDAGAALIGVNNRDLRTFETDLGRCIALRQQIPDECVVVGESGIHSRADALRLEQAHVDAMLVGEHLMAQSDVGQAVAELLGLPG